MLEREENDLRVRAIWADVKDLARTDSEALDIFCQRWIEDGSLVCSRCGSCNLKRESGCRTAECDDCDHITWVTSGTLLERADRFQAYLAGAIIRESGLFISSAGLARLTDIHYSTAYNITRKFNMAIASQIPPQAREVSGRFFELIIAKRTRETPANMHPYSEQKFIDDDMTRAESFESEDGQQKFEDEQQKLEEDSKRTPPEDEFTGDYSEAKKICLSMLSHVGITAHSISAKTGIASGMVSSCLFQLELIGKARCIAGGKYFLCAPSAVEQFQNDSELAYSIALVIADFMIMVKKYFHRIGRKGIQNYLACLWFTLDKVRWGAGSLVSLCGKHPPISYGDMLNYVSPPMLKIMVC